MKYLLDTQVFLWYFESPERLTPAARRILSDESAALFFSAASSWEIAIKVGLKKLRLPQPLGAYVAERLQRLSLLSLPIEHTHALRVAELKPHHRDPFDRMLVAQAACESMTLISADPVFKKYGVQLVKA